MSKHLARLMLGLWPVLIVCAFGWVAVFGYTIHPAIGVGVLALYAIAYAVGWWMDP